MHDETQGHETHGHASIGDYIRITFVGPLLKGTTWTGRITGAPTLHVEDAGIQTIEWPYGLPDIGCDDDAQTNEAIQNAARMQVLSVPNGSYSAIMDENLNFYIPGKEPAVRVEYLGPDPDEDLAALTDTAQIEALVDESKENPVDEDSPTDDGGSDETRSVPGGTSGGGED